MPATEAFVYREGELVDRLVVRELADRGLTPRECAWIRLSGPVAGDLAVLQATFGLSPIAIVDMLDRDRWTILEQHEDYVFVSFRGTSPSSDGSAALVGTNFIITIEDAARPEHHRLHLKAGENAALLAHGPDHILYALFANVMAQYAAVLATLEERVMQVGQRSLLAERIDRPYESVSTLRIGLRQVKEVLQSFADLEGPFARRAGSTAADRLCGPFAALFKQARHLAGSVAPLLVVLDTAADYGRHKVLFQQRRRRSLVIAVVLVPLMLLLTIHAALDRSLTGRLGFVAYLINLAARGGLALCMTMLLMDLIRSPRRT